LSFGTENEEQALNPWHMPERLVAAFRQQYHFLRRWSERLFKLAEIIPYTQIHIRPIIQTGPFDFAAGQGEAKGSDEVKGSSGTQAGASGISGVPVYFRGYENNMSLDGH